MRGIYSQRIGDDKGDMKEQIEADKIEKLMEKWAKYAALIERLYGPDKPECKAIRECIGGLNGLLNEDDF